MEFPNEKLGGMSGYTWKTPTPSIAARFKMGQANQNTAGWLKWCERELSKVPGGLDGLTKTETGYSNQIEMKEVA